MTTLLISIAVAINLSGWMVGNEIAVGVFVHPKLWTLSRDTHLQAVEPITMIYGVVMPFWYAATLASSLFVSYQLYREANGTASLLALIASGPWLCFYRILYLASLRLDHVTILPRPS